MKNTVFKGYATAMVTPMTSTGVDYDTLERFIEFQIENGIHALVAVGTTGESATLSPEERKAVIRFTVKKAKGRVPVIAGCGTNNTEHVLDFTKSACDDGADAILAVLGSYFKDFTSITFYCAYIVFGKQAVFGSVFTQWFGCLVLKFSHFVFKISVCVISVMLIHHISPDILHVHSKTSHDSIVGYE